MKIVLIHGENVFESKEKLKQNIDNELTAKKGVSVKYIDASQIKNINELELDQSISMFYQPKLIVLKRLFQNTNKELINSIITQLSKLKDLTNIYLWEDGNVDKRTSLFKQLAKEQKVIECRKLSTNELISWIQSYSKINSLNISPKVAFSILERVGTDQEVLATEINKLVVLKLKNVDIEEVNTYLSLSNESNIFQLTDAVVDCLVDKRNMSQVIKLADLLEDYKNYPIFLSNLVNQLSNLIRIKRYLNKNISRETIKEKLGIHPFVLSKLLSKVEKLDYDLLTSKLKLLLTLDFEFKNGGLTGRDVAIMMCK